MSGRKTRFYPGGTLPGGRPVKCQQIMNMPRGRSPGAFPGTVREGEGDRRSTGEGCPPAVGLQAAATGAPSAPEAVSDSVPDEDSATGRRAGKPARRA